MVRCKHSTDVGLLRSDVVFVEQLKQRYDDAILSRRNRRLFSKYGERIRKLPAPILRALRCTHVRVRELRVNVGTLT